MRQKASTALLFILFSLAGLAQKRGETVWDRVTTGYNRASGAIRITRVVLNPDSTSVTLNVRHRKGGQIDFSSKTLLEADGQEYALLHATVPLDEAITMPDDSLSLVMTFSPLPTTTWLFDFVWPGAMQIRNIRSADRLPTGLTDTYWRSEATGEWLIGFTEGHIIYNNKVWDIASQTQRKDAYALTLDDGTAVRVGKMRKGLRDITVGGKTVACSPITTESLPDYPTTDTRMGFTDNGYRATDSVTIVGWLKGMPEEAWQKSKEFSVGIVNSFSVDEESFYGKMDSLGRFCFKMPLAGSSQTFIDWGRTTASSVLEPGKTYFFLYDFTTGQKLWMGDDVRLQNELLAHPHPWDYAEIDRSEGARHDAMLFWKQTDSIRTKQAEDLERLLSEHPKLSERYVEYIKGYQHNLQFSSMMTAHFYMTLPEDYMDFVTHELWLKAPKPYTLYRDFVFRKRDYVRQVVGNNVGADVSVILKHFEVEGKLSLSEDEKSALDQYATAFKQVMKDFYAAPTDEERQSIATQFNEMPLTKTVLELAEKHTDLLERYNFQRYLTYLDSIGTDRQLRDITFASLLFGQIDGSRTPLNPSVLSLAEEEIQLPWALATVETTNDKYLALQHRDISKKESLKSNADIAGMSDGEQLLRKITEPYRGRIILLDVWGTWCGPCKAALAKSKEEYERLKDYDLVYLYLCNNSSDESWKNVIKEYDLVGDNIVHYNLPHDRQSAIEHFLNVNAFPTYKLIDREGNVLDINAEPRDLEGLARLLDQLK